MSSCLKVWNLRAVCFTIAAVIAVVSESSVKIAVDQKVEVIFETGQGNVHIEVFVERAPMTAAYFLELVDAGKYDGATFYRTATFDGDPAPQILQGGLLYPWLRDGAARDLPAGIEPLPVLESTAVSGLLHRAGTVSMARDLMTTGAVIPELFICLREAPMLNFGNSTRPDMKGFPAFGRVTNGMRIVSAIAKGERKGETHISILKNQILTAPIAIKRAYRVTEVD